MSTRITDSMTSRLVLSDIENVSSQLSKTQQRLSSGKQLTAPSDDPFGTSRALLYRSEVASNQQYQKNVDDANSWQTVTDTALNEVGKYALLARDRIVQGANGALDQTGRDSIASELDQIIDSIKTEANTQYAGRFVFAGSATQTAPYVLGGTPPDDTYKGNSDQLVRQIGLGVQVPINITADDGSGTGVISGLIAQLRQAAADLRSGNVAALGNGDLKGLDTAKDAVTTARAVVGARTNRLDAASDRLQQLEETSTKLLSDTEDADMAQTMIDYSMQSSVYQAALKSGANLIQPSLLDFLN
ncbi:MAG TPA: flagellar hook-associated protein FlgL [Gaiellaceae bacterium]